jgi:hypothetical protein
MKEKNKWDQAVSLMTLLDLHVLCGALPLHGKPEAF